jgi:hypothetical protein
LRATAARGLRCALGLAAFLVAGLAAPHGAHAATCTGGTTLLGSYGMLVSGATPANLPKYLIGVLNFNGACGITGSVTIGEPNTAIQALASVTGSYNTNSDGSITLSLTLPNVSAPETYTVGFSQGFGEALGQEDDSTAVATIDLKSQNAPLGGTAPTYTNASLKGQFTVACGSGVQGGFSDLNLFSFDGTSNSNGAGGMTGQDYYNNSAHYGVLPYTGTYITQANGNFTGTVTVGGGTYGFSGVTDNNGNEIQYVYTQPSGAAVAFVACTGKRVAATTATTTTPTFACHVAYSVTSQVVLLYSGTVSITNTGNAPVSSWKLGWTYSGGQVLTGVTNGSLSQSGSSVAISNLSSNGSIAAGATLTGIKFSGISGLSNPAPSSFTVNGTTCK